MMKGTISNYWNKIHISIAGGKKKNRKNSNGGSFYGFEYFSRPAVIQMMKGIMTTAVEYHNQLCDALCKMTMLYMIDSWYCLQDHYFWISEDADLLDKSISICLRTSVFTILFSTWSIHSENSFFQTLRLNCWSINHSKLQKGVPRLCNKLDSNRIHIVISSPHHYKHILWHHTI